jgi:hypothetical protein
MSLSSSEEQRLAIIEAGLAGDRKLVELAGHVGVRGARWRWRAIVAAIWLGFPLAVSCTAGLGVALLVGAPVAAYALAPVLALLWPLVALAAWRRWRRWGVLL